MNQEFTESEILKSILKRRGMRQEDLCQLINMGRTKMSMALSLPVLPDELKEKVIKALNLPIDTFPERSSSPKQSDLEALVPDLLKKVDLLLAQQQQMFAQNKQLLELLQARA